MDSHDNSLIPLGFIFIFILKRPNAPLTGPSAAPVQQLVGQSVNNEDK